MPRRARLTRMILMLACLPVLAWVSASAQAPPQDAAALKQRTAARAPLIASYLASGVAHEGPNGFLSLTAAQPSDQQQQTVSEENRDRAAIFKLIAAQTGETPDQVAALYAQRAQKQNPPTNAGSGSAPPKPPDQCSDRQLAVLLRDRFDHDEDLRGDPIQVDVANKTVILSGAVVSDLARNYAADLVRNSGCPVASVVNDLTINPDKTIATQIRQEFAKEADLRGQHIQVEVSHANVILTGAVSDNLMRTVAGTTASQVAGVRSVTNNIQVGRPERNGNGNAGGGGGTTHSTVGSLSGLWMGTFDTCAQGHARVTMRITEAAPDDITAATEIDMPSDPPGTFTAHGVLNSMNSYLALQFSGWQHQPPGMMMGNIGGLVTYSNQQPSAFSGIVRQPGCGNISLKKQ